MKTKYHFFLAFLMLLTGSLNTITTKYADISCAKGTSDYPRDQTASSNPCPARSEGSHPFDHPFVQAMAMFIGEFTCLLALKFFRLMQSCQGKENEALDSSWSPLIFAIPALCDFTATSTMYLGLTLTFASQFQMLRGSVIIFTGLLSHFVLKNRQKGYQWLGMLFVLIGLVFVGLAAFFGGSSDSSAPNPILGDALIIAAQVIVAIQMVVEEKFLGQYKVHALQAVGWEGVFGMLISCVFCIIFYFTPGPRAGGKFENINDAIAQITNSWQITLAICGTIVSIAFFNFSGISVTKEMSATTRMVLDSVRTLTVWAYGMIVGWETFSYFQIVGFLMLILGTFVYNDIVVAPMMRRYGCLKQKSPCVVEVIDDGNGESKPLLDPSINSVNTKE